MTLPDRVRAEYISRELVLSALRIDNILFSSTSVCPFMTIGSNTLYTIVTG
jgi:hypothetical protein